MNTLLCFSMVLLGLLAAQGGRPRARDLGLAPGSLPPGPLNAITDVPGVRVGHVTLVEGEGVRTGVTAILPHGGNVYREKVPAAIQVGNGFGKLVGVTQVDELGLLETPIVLTNTLAVWTAAEALADYVLAQAGNEDVRSINPVVGETNDGLLNDIRGHHVRKEHVRRALEQAREGPVEEGSVGAGTGTVAFGWKGGIGTASRHVAGRTLGALVQSNYGGSLTMNGIPVPGPAGGGNGDGSCMMVLATDAPLDARQLKRLARRALFGFARTGSSGSHGSGDYVIAFSTARQGAVLTDEQLSPLFQAAIEATEEAILNSLLRATTVKGRGGRVVEAVPLDKIKALIHEGHEGTRR
jgi:D-aminopeptidase